jgi:hypothetical protein
MMTRSERKLLAAIGEFLLAMSIDNPTPRTVDTGMDIANALGGLVAEDNEQTLRKLPVQP